MEEEVERALGAPSGLMLSGSVRRIDYRPLNAWFFFQGGRAYYLGIGVAALT
jgi:hypothetical protein